MIPDPSGSTPAPYDMTLTCLEIINPECFGDEAIVSFEWEISSGTTMGIFSLINTTNGEELNGDLNLFQSSGAETFIQPIYGEYDLVYNVMSGGDDFYYNNIF